MALNTWDGFALSHLIEHNGKRYVELDHAREMVAQAAIDAMGGCPKEYAHPFFVYDFMPQKVMFKSERGDDSMALDVLQVRGWGHLTGFGQAGLRINPEAAAEIQDNFGRWVAKTLTAALYAESSPPAPKVD